MFVLFMSSDMSGSVFTVISLQHRMSAYSKSHNPFADDDDDEDSKPRRGFNFDDDPEESSLSPAERRQRQLQQEVMHTAQSAVDSSLPLARTHLRIGESRSRDGGGERKHLETEL